MHFFFTARAFIAPVFPLSWCPMFSVRGIVKVREEKNGEVNYERRPPTSYAESVSCLLPQQSVTPRARRERRPSFLSFPLR